MSEDETDRRVRRIRRHLDLATGPGLEIGPLHSPIVTRDDADVRYVDVHLTPGLKAHYASHPGTPVDQIVEVDHALIHEGRTRSLPEAVADDAPFAWVVASHVVEHVPDVIGWLAEVAEVLADDGTLALAIPDRRYCFDALRPASTVGQLLQAHLDGDVRPSARAVFDHFDQAADVDLGALWQGQAPDPGRVIHGPDFAWAQVRRLLDSDAYVDCHVWLFTPASFVDQLRTLARLGHLELALHAVDPTPPGDMEFCVTLRRPPRHLDDGARRQAILASFDDPAVAAALAGAARPPLQPSPEIDDDGPSAGEPIAASALERRAIMAKRRVMEAARALPRRLRRRGPS